MQKKLAIFVLDQVIYRKSQVRHGGGVEGSAVLCALHLRGSTAWLAVQKLLFESDDTDLIQENEDIGEILEQNEQVFIGDNLEEDEDSEVNNLLDDNVESRMEGLNSLLQFALLLLVKTILIYFPNRVALTSKYIIFLF